MTIVRRERAQRVGGRPRLLPNPRKGRTRPPSPVSVAQRRVAAVSAQERPASRRRGRTPCLRSGLAVLRAERSALRAAGQNGAKDGERFRYTADIFWTYRGQNGDTRARKRPTFKGGPCSQVIDFGAGTRIRTGDLLITNQLLYQLSYAGAGLRF